MRKHDVRKWLHAVLDLLPVILIPVFMIYSHRHTIDSGSIQVPQNEVVDFNQLVVKNPFPVHIVNNRGNNTKDISKMGNINVTYNEYVYTLNGITTTDRSFYLYENINIVDNHQYYIKHNYSDSITHNYSSWGCGVRIGNVFSYFEDTIFTSNNATGIYWFVAQSYEATNVTFYLQLFDLTQMFGIGNEPTISQFNEWYPNSYYDYTLSHKELLKGVSTIIYDDTDISSQLMYQLYNSVDKYFNMGNVFNMTGVYDWFNLNIFNGNAPISIYIVWNIVLYEFVMDLLFLLYGLFMWFIDMVEKLMEKPLKSVK